MNIYIDNKILSRFKTSQDPFILPLLSGGEIVFGWPSLLEFLGQGSLFEQFPVFSHNDPLFANIISTLTTYADNEVLIRLYDQVFVECLTQVKALKQVNLHYLLELIRIHKRGMSELLKPAVERYENRILKDPANTLHDLTLYLAWDRVCVHFGILFDYHNSELPPFCGMEVFRECLLESFQHITDQGRTKPGFYRLLECLYAYYMRDEKIQCYDDEVWQILCKTSTALRPRNRLSDIYYVDNAVFDERNSANLAPVKFLTCDQENRVVSGIAFAQYILNTVKGDNLSWHYSLDLAEIECLP